MSDIKTEYRRDCPSCGRDIFYKEKRNMNDANKKNTFCRRCKKERLNLKNKENTIYIRNCPICDKKLYYYTKSKLNRANKNNSNCGNCSAKILGEKKRLSVTPQERKKRKEKRAIAAKKYRDKYYWEHRDKLLKKQRLHSQKPEVRKRKKEYKKKYDEDPENKKRAIEYRKNYGQRPYVKEMKRLFQRKKRKNIKIKISNSIASGIRFALKNRNINKDRRHWETLVINTKEEIIEHLEKHFLPGMTLQNYGKWHIHHITPVEFFQFTSTDDVEFKYMWSTENLIPLWEEKNREKSDKIVLWGKEIRARDIEKDYFSKLTYKKVS